jgi:hypothetical protein
MSVIGYLGGNLRVECMKRPDGLEEVGKERPEEGEELVGGLKRVGGVREVYERVEDYDPVLRRHCRL